MPPEILDLVMQRLCVQDIIHLAQTCSRIRASIRGSKYPLAHAVNTSQVMSVHLKTIDMMSPMELYDAAAKATALSARMTPDTADHTLMPRRRLTFDIKGSPDHFWNRMLLLDNFIFFVLSNLHNDTLWILDLSSGLMRSRDYDSISGLDYQAVAQSNSVLVFLAIYSENSEMTGHSLIVDEFTLDTGRLGYCKTHFVMRCEGMEEIPSVSLEVKGDRVAFIWFGGILVVDWKEKRALELELEFAQYTDYTVIVHACFHPSHNSVIAGYRCGDLYETASIGLPELPPLTEENKIWVNTELNHGVLELQDLDLFRERQSWGKDARLPSTIFRQNGGCDTYDAVIFPPKQPEAEYISAEHLRYSTQTWKGFKIPISSVVQPPIACHGTDEERIAPNGAPFLFIDQSEKCVYTLRLADDYHRETTWVRLSTISSNLYKEGDDPLDGKALHNCIAGYDTLQGRLVLFVDQRLEVLEY
ncbi:hypothetical protein SISSUDRAFT_1053872 [Sistotremastrum suecicum HHB10207 ss-3]|uniref:F-box domain-containing protein n=1 Tax=Sistotremastrum suecicum HHB10207 ss-3 TaxID=1314776 RepID=A0A165YXK8_9AGAM|nr:hypothetical protein SISSUDRAFT_1053872 [Sistotremastrum suecicum HHB10207 ss-3]